MLYAIHKTQNFFSVNCLSLLSLVQSIKGQKNNHPVGPSHTKTPNKI